MKIAQLIHRTLAAAAMMFLGAAPAGATLQTVTDYSFENNATPAGFTAVGSPTYSGGQLVLNGTNCLTKATPLTATDNFGIEVIATPTTNDSFNFIVANNNGANNGWGLVQISGTNQAIAEGAATFGLAGAATLGTPVRLALVRAGGVATVYRNGVASGTTQTAAVTLVVPGVVNGGFESSFTGWTRAGTTSTTTTSTLRHSGSRATIAGSTSSRTNGDSSVSQTFTANGSTVSFWYKLRCPETVAVDWATATLVDNTTATTTTVLAKTCSNLGTWVQVSSPVTAGHSYTLKLVNHDNNSTVSGSNTYTAFDDIVG